jgi:hypothetical protein
MGRSRTVVTSQNVDDLLGEIVQIEDWRVSIQANCMELVRVLHGLDGKGLEVLLVDGLLHTLHTLGDDDSSTMLQHGKRSDCVCALVMKETNLKEIGSLNRALHSIC